MLRRIWALVIVLGILAITPAAEAGWGHRHGGWGHHHGWRGGWGHHHGWRGGWGGWNGYGVSVGWGGGWNNCGWGGVYIQPRAINYNYCAPALSWPSWGCGNYYDGCGVGVGYYAYEPGGVYYNPQANFTLYNLPAVYQPAEVAYGPLAAKQFLGLDRNFALAPLREPPLRLPLLGGVGREIVGREIAGREVVLDRGEVRAARPAVRVSSSESRRKAERYLADGDALYRAQKFHSALQKYKLAATTAPDQAEAYWRQGHAMIATSNFTLAAGAFKRAIALSDDLSRGGFMLNDLYGTAGAAKTVHIEQLAEHALTNEDSADPYFLLGVTLAYDGQPERAAKFFARSADLAGISGGHIAAMLDGIDAGMVAARTVVRPVSTSTERRPAPPRPRVTEMPVSVGSEIEI